MSRALSVAARVFVGCLILPVWAKVGWGQAVLAWAF